MTTTYNPLYDWFGLNKAIFLAINSLHGPVVDRVAVVITHLGDPNLFPFYLALVLMARWRYPAAMPTRKVVVFAASYALSSVLIVPLLKTAFDFPRPLTVLGAAAVTVLGHPDAARSFPSGHAAFAVMMAASLLPGLSRLRQAALVSYAALVCLSRISVGAHFPADVVAGAAISIIIVSCVRYLSATFWGTFGRRQEDWNDKT